MMEAKAEVFRYYPYRRLEKYIGCVVFEPMSKPCRYPFKKYDHNKYKIYSTITKKDKGGENWFYYFLKRLCNI